MDILEVFRDLNWIFRRSIWTAMDPKLTLFIARVPSNLLTNSSMDESTKSRSWLRSSPSPAPLDILGLNMNHYIMERGKKIRKMENEIIITRIMWCIYITRIKKSTKTQSKREPMFTRIKKIEISHSYNLFRIFICIIIMYNLSNGENTLY